MDDRERNILDSFISVREFDRRNAADYAALPDAAANFAVIDRSIEASRNSRGDAGVRRAQTRRRAQGGAGGGDPAAIRRRMKDIARTARALNIADEGFSRLFRVPDDNSEQKLLAAAREFAREAAEHKAAFLRLGMPADFVEHLEGDIAVFETAAGEKADAQSAGAGAAAAIDAAVRRGTEAATVLNAILQNVYRNDPVKLAAWTQARHVRRAPRRAPAPKKTPA